MCGRYVAPDGTLIEGVISERHWLPSAPVIKVPNINYNAAPSQFVPIITPKGPKLARFGLLPEWAKDFKYTMINAMAETLEEKRTYKGLLKDNRCLVPALGYYEWHQSGDSKQPYYFSLKDRKVFMLAGLYTSRTDPDDYESFSFTIITCQPNSLQKPIHNRMPVVLEKQHEEIWLSGEKDAALDLLAPYPSEEMQVWKVGNSVGSPKNNNADLIKAV